MLKKLLLAAGFIMTIILSCKETTIEPVIDLTLAKVVGKYRAVTLLFANNGDDLSDVLAYGGKLEVELFSDYTAKGNWSSPVIPLLFYEPVDEIFSGSFKILSTDSLQFVGMYNSPLSGRKFRIEQDSLKWRTFHTSWPNDVINLKKY
jgi:hypothetical protein